MDPTGIFFKIVCNHFAPGRIVEHVSMYSKRNPWNKNTGCGTLLSIKGGQAVVYIQQVLQSGYSLRRAEPWPLSSDFTKFSTTKFSTGNEIGES